MSTQHWLWEPSNTPKRIIFARHGEYECNVLGVCNSDPRIPYSLTRKGLEQASNLGVALRNEDIDLVVTSQHLRTRQTAQHAIEQFDHTVPRVVNRLANENRVGAAFEGKPAVDFLRSIAHAPATACAADGEPFMGLLERVECLIADLRGSSATTTLVVAHGWTLQAVRVLKGEINADDAAQNIGMPGNCARLELLV